MDLRKEMVLPSPPAQVWRALTDFRRAAACVPGCEDIEELRPLERYRGVMRQRVGPFKLEAPVEIAIDKAEPPSSLHAQAKGRDRLTGTAVNVDVTLSLAPADGDSTLLAMAFAINVTGRLATLGFPIIRHQTEDVINEFGIRLRAMLLADAAP